MRKGDLYLLCYPDVAWSADGLQRDRPHRREEMHALFLTTLAEFQARVVHVQGSWAEREALAWAATSSLLRGRWDAQSVSVEGVLDWAPESPGPGTASGGPAPSAG